MKMRLAVFASALALCCGSTALWAQTGSNNVQVGASSSSNSDVQPSKSAMATRDRLIKNLKSSGFTDVKVQAESFLVRAKDKDGDPVMMVINPDSLTAVVGSTPATGRSNSNGSSNNGSSSNGASTNQ